MGRSITTTYRVEVAGWMTTCYFHRPRPAINRPADGAATEAGLASYMERFVASMSPGGANEHLSHLPLPRSARLVRQSTGEVIARWTPETTV